MSPLAVSGAIISVALPSVVHALPARELNALTTVGHSLGPAISLLDFVYLPLQLPNATFRFIRCGLLRVGNQAFDNYVDAQIFSMTHINNKEDPVPTLPSMFLGYVHPSGEIHTEDPGEWDACPGQDNPSTQCIVSGALSRRSRKAASRTTTL